MAVCMSDDEFAFEQVDAKYPMVKEAITEWCGGEDARSGGRWRVEWDDGTSRTTGVAGLAWMADQYDDEAEVEVLE